MYATLIVAAVLWGASAGLLVPRAAYRLSVEPEEAWRDACPGGHRFTGPAHGWLGGARCAACAAGAVTLAVPAAGTEEARATRTDEARAAGAEPAGGSGTERARGAGTEPARDTRTQEARPMDTEEARPTDTEEARRADTEEPRSSDTEEAARTTRTQGPQATPEQEPLIPGRLLAPAVTALSCATLAAAIGPRPELAVWVLLAPLAVLLALVDRTVHRLPDRLTLPLAAAAAVLLGLAALLPGAAGSWPTALLGGLTLGAAYFVLFLIHPNGMGFGDVKLALSLGVALGWYGWAVLFTGAFAGFLLGSLYGLGLIVLRRANRKTAIPFGPFMIVGALTGLLLGGLAAAP
ncbi:prepilin peptidase [Streptomyces sp. NBC_01142]|uniref:prepilin peptidase n=1 Tax=Streptomyces sp. NBC_01142 TaxID=2975865 RepID=UPI002254E051|nr:prepilin peptidase [Streptomyces sp. NBC_01142]MCX4819088.1 prepilin peptidase [Streptomyces sp. NBC_01142]